MPVFGDYSTIGEPVAVVDERGHVSTVWQARLSESSDGRLYVIKAYSPRKRSTRHTGGEGSLDHDRRLEFLEGIKELKKAQATAPNSLAPVHAFGIAPEGAWYVTDFYPRSLKTWINLGVRADSAALRHVLYSLIAGCLALKRSRGFSHGNLKTSNIFLVGKPRPLRKTPLHISDPYPASSYHLAQLDATDRQAVGDLLTQTMEAHDLRTLGELILQLVEGRLISGSYEYDYPVAKTAAWDQLGRDGERWRALCNRLLDPQLSLEKINLEMLEKEFRPSAVAGKAVMVVGGVVIVCLIGGGFYGFHHWIQWRQAKKYEALLSDAQNKYNSTLNANVDSVCVSNLLGARDAANQASKYPLTANRAADLEKEIDLQIDKSYSVSLVSAEQESKANAFGDASNSIQLALVLKPADTQALNAQKNLLAKESDDFLTQGNSAEKNGNWAEARGMFDHASQLGHAAGDSQREKLAGDKRDYADAIDAGINAQQAGDVPGVQKAISKAQAIRPDTPELKRLKEWAKSRTTHDELVRLASEAQGKIRDANWPDADQSLKAALDVATTLNDSSQKSLGEELYCVSNIIASEAALTNGQFQEARNCATNAMRLEWGVAAARDLFAGIEKKEREKENKLVEDEKRAAMLKAGQEGTAAEEADRWGDAVKDFSNVVNLADQLNAQSQLRTARLEVSFATDMRDGLDAYTRGDFQLASDKAVAALALKSGNRAADGLRQKAKDGLSRDSKYKDAMTEVTNSWKRAKELGDSDEAIAKYNLAIANCETAENLKASPEVRALEGSLQTERDDTQRRISSKAEADTNLVNATMAFTSGDYSTASKFCADYPNDQRFIKLQKQVSDEQNLLAQAQADLEAGNYENIAKQTYPRKDPFSRVLEQSKKEEAELIPLESEKQTNNWRAVHEKLTDRTMAPLLRKEPFKELNNWASTAYTNAQKADLDERNDLDTSLEIFLKNFNISVPRWLDMPKAKDAKEKGGLSLEWRAYYQREVDRLRQRYSQLGILDDHNRKALLDQLKDSIKGWP